MWTASPDWRARDDESYLKKSEEEEDCDYLQVAEPFYRPGPVRQRSAQESFSFSGDCFQHLPVGHLPDDALMRPVNSQQHVGKAILFARATARLALGAVPPCFER
jgi:hypothetical protein